MGELNTWIKYRNKYGSLDVNRNLERASALVSYIVSCTIPRKPGSRAPKFEDFIPQRNEPISLEDAMKQWK